MYYDPQKTRDLLEELYCEFNRREYVSPDPLQFLYCYDSPADREVVGLIASSLAYGKVGSILQSVRRVLAVLGESPASALAAMSKAELAAKLDGFVHRFADSRQTTAFLYGVGEALRQHGSLENLFCSAARLDGRQSLIAAADDFVGAILGYAGLEQSHLFPRPSKGSACKRLFLFLRWMTRSDDVDPGGWRLLAPSDILVPLDTHMFKITRGLGLVERSCADGRAALLATDGFAALTPADPVRYDFALTRFGIRDGMTTDELLERFRLRCGN